MATRHEDERWVLGFDGSCCACSGIAQRVVALSDGRLTARSLREPEVLAWRERVLGADARWAPTLFHLRGDVVRAWTGVGMTYRLTRLLGPARTWRVATLAGGVDFSSPVIPNRSRRRFVQGVGAAVLGLPLALHGGRQSPGPINAASATGNLQVARLDGALFHQALERIRTHPDSGQLWSAALEEGFVPTLDQAHGITLVGSGTPERRRDIIHVPFVSRDGRSALLISVLEGPKLSAGLGNLILENGRFARTEVREAKSGRIARAGTLAVQTPGLLDVLDKDGRVTHSLSLPPRLAGGEEPEGDVGTEAWPSWPSRCTTCEQLFGYFTDLSCGLTGYFACTSACAVIASIFCPVICTVVWGSYCYFGGNATVDQVCSDFC